MVPIDVADRAQLFIDRRFLAVSEGIELVAQPAQKRETVLRPGAAEGRMQCQVASVVGVDGRLVMYYLTFPDQGPAGVRKSGWHVTRLAVSENGIHWDRPRVGLIDDGAGHDNNIVLAGGVGTVFLDPNGTDGCRYWWIGHLNETPWWPETSGTVFSGGEDKEGAVYLCRSPDGLRWERLPEPILPFWCDTRNQCLWDPRLGRYVAYLRARPGGHTCRVVARAESPALAGPWRFTPNPDRRVGAHGCYGWLEDELPVVLRPGELDPPATGFYSPNVHVYPWADDVYLAFPEAYRCRDGVPSHGRDQRGQPVNEGPLEPTLLVSRDGSAWDRFPIAYVPLGRRGEIDGGTVYMGPGLVRRGDEIWQYAAVSPHTHHGRHQSLPGTDGGILRTVQRLDGFVAAEAGPAGGELTTPPLVFTGSRLWLNLDCGAMGEIWVELQDAAGRSLPGHILAECASLELNGTAEEVWWRGGPDIGRWAGTPMRVRLRLRSARLYSFRFAAPGNAR